MTGVELVGARVKLLRKSRGWTLKDLAARSGLSPAAISRIENGRSGLLQTFVALARALDVTTGVLSGEEPGPVRVCEPCKGKGYRQAGGNGGDTNEG